MEDTVIKQVRRYGNSGGVYVPSAWIGGKVKIELVEEPLNPKDVLSKVPLEHVISAIMYGSYARDEAAAGSDLDILLVVDDDARIEIPAEIKQKYDLQVKSLGEMRNALVHDPVFYKTIKDSGVALINHGFLDILKTITPDLDCINKRVEIVESSIKIMKAILEMDENAEIIYPLMMRLKEILLIQYLISKKKYSTKALKQEILNCGITRGELSAMLNAYRAARDNKKIPKTPLSKDSSQKLISLVEKKIEHVRQKTRGKRH